MPYKLYYFNTKGRAEFIRLIFAEAGQEFEDIRFEHKDWAEEKPKLTLPFGQVPVLEDDGKCLTQSITIARYVADKLGLRGETEWDKAVADSYVDVIWELAVGFYEVYIRPKDPASVEEKKEKYISETWSSKAKCFQQILEDNVAKKHEFLVGQKVTYADLLLMMMVMMIKELCPDKLPEYFKDFPLIREHGDKIEKRPNVAEYIKKAQDDWSPRPTSK